MLKLKSNLDKLIHDIEYIRNAMKEREKSCSLPRRRGLIGEPLYFIQIRERENVGVAVLQGAAIHPLTAECHFLIESSESTSIREKEEEEEESVRLEGGRGRSPPSTAPLRCR